MTERVFAEILSAYADHLTCGETEETEYLMYLTLFPEHQEELAPLLELTRRIREILAPVRPAEAFRKRLRQELVALAERRLASLPREARPHWRRAWLIGAAALGSVIASILGVIAYLRHLKAAKPAAAS